MKNEIIVDGITYVPKETNVESNDLKAVLIRTYSAGVHYGYLKYEKDVPAGIKVKLNDARRVWSWSGAASLSQMSVDGVKNPNVCKFPCKVSEITLIAIEILPLTEKALKSLDSVKVWEK